MLVPPDCSAAGAGLVSVSTTRKGVDEPLVIDTEAARFTRLQKNVGIAGKLHQIETQGRGYHVLFVTLTYRHGDDWRGTHLTAYMDRVRNHYRACTGDRLRYVWVGETQERGAIHYHVVFWVKRTYFMPKADKRGWWAHGMTKTEKARLSGGSVVYLMSYIKKHQSKKGLPRGARVYGVGGLESSGRDVRRWVNLPSFLQARAAVTDRYQRQVGGGFVNRVTGEWWPSEWGFCLSTGKHTALVRLHTHPRLIADVVGPYSWNPSVAGPDGQLHQPTGKTN